MKNINKLQKIIFIIIIALIIAMGIYVLTIFIPNKKANTKIDKEETIKYDYTVYKRDSSLYKETFKDLKKVLDASEIDYNKYAEDVTKLFIIDFYTLNNKLSKDDIGGLQYIKSDFKDNFILNARNTIYKYIENNSDGKRNQELPEVSNVKTEKLEKGTYEIDKISYEAYILDMTFEYKKDLGYDTSAKFTLIKDGEKLYIVEESKMD